MTGADLRSRREALGLSYREAARQLGVSFTSLYRWERGEMAIEHPAMLDAALRELEAREARVSRVRVSAWRRPTQ